MSDPQTPLLSNGETHLWEDVLRYKTVRRLISYAQSHQLQEEWDTKRELADRIDMGTNQVREHIDTLLKLGVYEEDLSDTAVYRPRYDSDVLDHFDGIEWTLIDN